MGRMILGEVDVVPGSCGYSSREVMHWMIPRKSKLFVSSRLKEHRFLVKESTDRVQTEKEPAACAPREAIK